MEENSIDMKTYTLELMEKPSARKPFKVITIHADSPDAAYTAARGKIHEETRSSEPSSFFAFLQASDRRLFATFFANSTPGDRYQIFGGFFKARSPRARIET
jgi:hypothetical protein